jgi:Kef-type K+ transport system membrane component KefB
VLLALAAVIVAGRLLGGVFVRIGQPPVVGEMIAGILLGPSLLGRVAPAVAAFVLPAEIAPYLGVIAQLGAVLYMFLVGLQFDDNLLRGRARATAAIAYASIVVPFALGAALAVFLYPRLSTNDVPFASFALFIGVAMSIAAFPVLARILADRNMSATELGIVALTCAAAGDVIAWCLLALVVGIVQAKLHSACAVAALVVIFLVTIVAVVRPAVARRLAASAGPVPGRGPIATALLCMLLCALATEWIGVHAILGAFLFGVVVPHDSGLARAIVPRLEDLVLILRLPAFFAFTGMRTRIDLLVGAQAWLMCALVVAVATLGKFGGTFAAARLSGMAPRAAANLGMLMNTRGLMEIVVLNIGLDLGVISPRLFAMMVIMAVVTTIATTPMLDAKIIVTRGAAEKRPVRAAGRQ